ncbi:EAL domain-containing protein [Candidatus Albibeggiatoa sp. nov. NOAA]|uniref:putative bifunctional diguanylate cyclase/phosphodiesterase n=1 Tax=Candidatus Albibeggiatoa sp. nov. NOAA TaxID=3162724 RepID=UPI0032F0B014|nr:EAL domain-containing protein [Thiotrichaceae bacterium]
MDSQQIPALNQLQHLYEQLETFKSQQTDLELVLQTIVEHGDIVEDSLLKKLEHLTHKVKVSEREKQDLEISLETIIEHSDSVKNELFQAQEFLEHQVANRTQELQEKNTQLKQEILERKRIEEAQRNSLIFLQTLLNNVPSPIYYKNLQGQYVGCNLAFERLAGHTADEIIGQTVHHIFPKDVAEYSKKMDTLLFRSRGDQNYETSLYYADGSRHEVVIQKTVFNNAEGDLVGLVGVIIDITERKRYEATLRLSASVFQGSNEGILITNASSKIISVNQAYENLTGYAEIESLGQNPNMLQSGKHDQFFYQNMWESLLSMGHWSGEIWNRRKNKELFPAWLSISAVKDKHGQTTHYIAIFTDITDKKLSEERLYRLSHYDALTDLANRVLFQDRIHQAMKRAVRETESIALLIIDIDHFKAINDAFGHTVGDELLCIVAQRLTSLSASIESVARLGGDEFGILLADLGLDQKAVRTTSHFADQILQSLQQPFTLAGQEIFTSVSIGVSIFPQDGDTVTTLMKNADAALYNAKEQGRNNYQFFASEMNIAAHKRLTMQNSLRRAIERDEFLLHYQPQVNPYTKEIIGVEALIRWKHPEMGMVSPVEFIPLAEDTGLIIPIGDWVLFEACQQNKRWQDAGYPKISMAVNLSIRQFFHEDLIQNVKNALAESGLEPQYLELEITESLAMTSIEKALETLEALKQLGVKIAIDDFGTGHSSLNYLKQFAVDTLKIDASFITDIATPKGAALVSIITDLAHILDMQVVAEGVQMPEQLEFLCKNKCDIVQGYLFHPPVLHTEIENLLPQSSYG